MLQSNHLLCRCVGVFLFALLTLACSGQEESVIFSPEPGIQSGPVSVSLSSSDPEAYQFFYTVDGETVPDIDNCPLPFDPNNPIEIEGTTELRVIYSKTDGSVSELFTEFYLYPEIDLTGNGVLMPDLADYIEESAETIFDRYQSKKLSGYEIIVSPEGGLIQYIVESIDPNLFDLNADIRIEYQNYVLTTPSGMKITATGTVRGTVHLNGSGTVESSSPFRFTMVDQSNEVVTAEATIKLRFVDFDVLDGEFSLFCELDGCADGYLKYLLDESRDLHFLPGGDSPGSCLEGVIRSGETLHEALALTETVVKRFVGESGQTVHIVAAGRNFVNPSFKLLSPSGLELKEVTPTGFTSTLMDFKLPEDGIYEIVLQDQFNDRAGPYSLSLGLIGGSLKSLQDPNGGAITSAQTMIGELDFADTDLYSFSGTAGQVLHLWASGTSNFVQPVIHLYDPDGDLETTYADGGSFISLLDEYQLQKTGTYTVVLGELGENNSGNYTISLGLFGGETQSTTDTGGGALTSGASVIEADLNFGDTDLYSFNGVAGDRIHISATGIDGGLPVVTLYAPDGSIETSEIPSNFNAAITDYQLQMTGSYTVVVNDFWALGEGAYQLAFASIPGPTVAISDADGGVLNSADHIRGSLHLADLDLYSFNGNAGQAMHLTVSGLNNFVQPVVYLYDPDGVLEVFNSPVSNINLIDEHNLAKTGSYTVLVKELTGIRAGDYSISLGLFGGATTSSTDTGGGAIHSAQSIIADMPYGDTDFYSFDGVEGETIYATAFGEGLLTVSLALYDSSGTREALYNGGSIAAIEQHKLLTSGKYTLVVRDQLALGIGSYNLSFAKVAGAITSASDPDGAHLTVQTDVASATFDVASDYDLFTFTGTAGLSVTIDLQALTLFLVPTAHLYDPSGELEVEFDITGNAAQLADYSLLNSGVYTIVVSESGHNHVGAYQVSITSD